MPPIRDDEAMRSEQIRYFEWTRHSVPVCCGDRNRARKCADWRRHHAWNTKPQVRFGRGMEEPAMEHKVFKTTQRERLEGRQYTK